MRVAIIFGLLFSLTRPSPCPDGYRLTPSGNDCYMGIDFYSSFATQYFPQTYDSAEAACSSKSGGMLASVHSQEDNDSLNGGSCGSAVHGMTTNIGLRCQGKVCKWDDGTPVTYTNFYQDPVDDGRTRCYGRGAYPSGQWGEKNCGESTGDCWVCRVKARTIDCVDGETEHRGGCVSVQTTPLDQKAADKSCPLGGHLLSIHSVSGSGNENEFFTKLASDAGVNGTIYIGGQFSNGVFQWTDGSYYGASNWAKSFPNTVFGTCVQLLLGSEFGNLGQWTNVDCSMKQASICFRDGATYDPTALPPQPKAPEWCPSVQYYTGSGSIYSPNYPLSIPGQQTCEYVLGTVEGTRPRVTFNAYDCESGTALSLYDGLNSKEPFLIFNTTSPSSGQSYTTEMSNVMKMVFSANGPSAPIGTGWEAEFRGIEHPVSISASINV